MTTTSADDGTSAGDSGAWGWFTPAETAPASASARSGAARSGPVRPDVASPRLSAPERDRPERSASVRGAGEPSWPTTVRPQPTSQSPTQPQALPGARPLPQSAPALPAAPQVAADAGRSAATTAAPPPVVDATLAGLSPDAVLLRRTMAEIEPIADTVTSYFYALLFIDRPGLRDLFPAAMDIQRERIFKALLTSAKLIDDDDLLTKFLGHLGRGHRKYGTRPEDYPALGESLLRALARYATRTWSEETEAAWVRAYTKISQIMIDASAEQEKSAPAWWEAEIVSHEPRTADIAVLTLRPSHPYPFVAGQYAAVETPWWPRVWRHYSFAARPRPDGLLSFHVKAVPAGWVSGALVHRARPGDVLRLGAAGGAMTVNHRSDSGLLCLGGGTGIAPIKALIEDIAEQGRRRSVAVFYGARSDHELYDLDSLLRLAQRHPWLSVRPVVTAGPAAGGLVGQLPDAVRRFGPWASYDGYLSGPPGMIRSGVKALVEAGVPAHRIRHDAVEGMVAQRG